MSYGINSVFSYDQSNNFAEVCPVCEKRFKLVGLLHTHMRKEHANEVSEELLASFQQAAQQAEEMRSNDKASYYHRISAQYERLMLSAKLINLYLVGGGVSLR